MPPALNGPDVTNGKSGTPAPTLTDVAVHAGVSPMTVSRALRDDHGVAEATRRRVRAAAEELGYRRNAFARGLKLGSRTGLVGLIVSNLANPFYSRLALGVEGAIAEAGLRLLLVNSGEDLELERELVAKLIGRRVEGIVVVSATLDHRHLAADRLAATPVVFAGRPPQSIEADCVLVDDFGGAYRLTKALFAKGHQRVAFIENRSGIYTSSERYRGFAAAHEEAGVRLYTSLVARNCVDADMAQAATRRLLSHRSAPTAVFAANNRLLLGVLMAIGGGEYGPLAVAGFDAIDYQELLDQELLLATFQPEELGRKAGQLLLRRMTSGNDFNDNPPMRVTVPVDVH